ncbi:MAG: haloacid dehalogenase type II [Chloroflexi bacterium]|nr:haloacid dehalogenase type II [Chloroflexota bacterium]
MTLTGVHALVFDAYGTLFDVRSVYDAVAPHTQDPGAFITLWRSKQLEYSWLRTLMDRFVDFEAVSRDALDHAADRFGLELGETDRQALMESWLRPDPFPDAEPALRALAGYPRAILSNGSRRMLDRVIEHSGFGPFFDQVIQVISVDDVRRFKPAPDVYRLVLTALDVRADDVLFVSANGFDVAGAKSFGFRVAWVNRANAPLERLGFAPDFRLTSLADLPALVTT